MKNYKTKISSEKAEHARLLLKKCQSTSSIIVSSARAKKILPLHVLSKNINHEIFIVTFEVCANQSLKTRLSILLNSSWKRYTKIQKTDNSPLRTYFLKKVRYKRKRSYLYICISNEILQIITKLSMA